MISLAYVLILTLAVGGQLADCWGQTDRDDVLAIHNNYRANVPNACQMNAMTYDMELEKQAESWAKRCVFAHEMKGNGENLAWNSASDPDKILEQIETKAWYDEVNMYRYGQYSCGSSCHYTQIVWANTTKVGCYAKRCPYLVNAYKNSWYLVCFYLPKGNWMGENPYPKSCASKCQAGQTETDGLCHGEPAGAAIGGDVETTASAPQECKDDSASCASWARSNQCARNPTYMLKSCKKSCGVCQSDEETTAGTTASSACVDDYDSCERWANRGECTRNPDWMLGNCKKSCRNC